MKNDSTLPLHPCWLDSELTLRCLTPADRAVHQAMSRVICQALPNEDWLIPLSQEEYDTIFAAGSDDVPSNTSLCHLGFRIIGEITRFGKRRNLLVMEI